MADAQRLKEIRVEAQRKAYRFVEVFENHPAGREVLAELKAQFADRTSIVPGDPYQTHAREGGREVILYIEQRIRSAKHAERMDDESA